MPPLSPLAHVARGDPVKARANIALAERGLIQQLQQSSLPAAEKIVRAVWRDKKSKLSKPLLPNLVGIVRSTGTYTI